MKLRLDAPAFVQKHNIPASLRTADRADSDGIEPFRKGRGQHNRHEEEPDHWARELTDQQRESIGRLLATDFVRTGFRQSALRFARREARKHPT